MSVSAPSWSVVATVDEPPALAQTFVAWHLHLGAERVFLYCDNPDDPVGVLLGHMPQVRVVRCDDAHWRHLGKSRPRRHQVRQVWNAGEAYALCSSDWLVHLDADEFLWPAESVSALLQTIEPEADAVVLQVAERVHRPDDPGQTIFEGAFRRPFRNLPRMGERIFGPDYALTAGGLTGHTLGKAFVRTGRPVKMSIHRPKPASGAPDLIMARPAPDAIELLHFDGLTPNYWVFKLARMQRALEKMDGMPPSAHRRAQADALMANPDAGDDLYRRMKVADRDLSMLLRRYDLWSAPAFDPRPALARFFPDVTIDLSPAAFDAWLVANKPAVLSYLSRRNEKGPPKGDPS